MEGNNMGIFPSLAVIALCGIIAFVLYLFMRGTNITQALKQFNLPRSVTNNPRPLGSCTVVSTQLYVDQLDEDRKTVIHRFSIGEIPKRGVSISRPDAQYGTVKLSGDVNCASTVSQEHARIGRDEQGFYIQENENGSTNGMYLADGTKVEEAAITDGMIIYLGDQPIRFVLPKRFASHVESGPNPERPAHQANIMRRRHT